MNFDLERFKIQRAGLIPVRLWNDLIDVVASSIITSFVGGTVVRSIHGTNLFSNQSAESISPFPFQCTLMPQTHSDGTPAGNKVAVEYNSTLFTELIPLTPFSGITGLFDPDTTSAGYPVYLDLDGPDNTANYTSPNGPDDYVFLEVKFGSDGYSVESVSVETKGNGNTTDPTYDAWDDSGNALVAGTTDTPIKQTYARIVLATYQDGQLQQNVMGNLVLTDAVINGNLARYPVPY